MLNDYRNYYLISLLKIFGKDTRIKILMKRLCFIGLFLTHFLITESRMLNQTSITQQSDSYDDKDAFLFSLGPNSRVV